MQGCSYASSSITFLHHENSGGGERENWTRSNCLDKGRYSPAFVSTKTQCPVSHSAVVWLTLSFSPERALPWPVCECPLFIKHNSIILPCWILLESCNTIHVCVCGSFWGWRLRSVESMPISRRKESTGNVLQGFQTKHFWSPPTHPPSMTQGTVVNKKLSPGG